MPCFFLLQVLKGEKKDVCTPSSWFDFIKVTTGTTTATTTAGACPGDDPCCIAVCGMVSGQVGVGNQHSSVCNH